MDRELMDTEAFNTLATIKEHATQWLFKAAAPLWAGAGVLEGGMFAERLSLEGAPQTAMNRRLRVQMRQIYSFCTIGRLGWDGPWREVANKAMSVLVQSGINKDGTFVHLYGPDGAVIDRSLDLYDHAFGLFALAHAGRALDKPEYFDHAAKLRDLMMQKWWRAEGGFWEGELHMFEAAVINFEVTGDQVWQDLADRLYELFVGRFFDAQSGAVTEYFDQNWGRLPAGEGDIVEPGHCLEWAWLFDVGVAEGRGASVADALSGFARQHGIDRQKGVAINEVYLDGRVRDGGARLWPQTERLKAAIARHARINTPETEAEIINAYRGLWLYLDMPVKGVWRDRLNADGTWVEEAAPASSFYHIVCALDQLLRMD
jgi:mannose/cellobiose epimerase-like protein (N-acyl-D-glucosamine 2-epimerase family)